MNANIPQNQIAFIRLDEVKKRTGLSRSGIYAFMSQGRFPKNIKITEKCVAWVESEITAWLEAQIKKRDM